MTVDTASGSLEFSGEHQSNAGHTFSPSLAAGETSRAVTDPTRLIDVEPAGDGYRPYDNVFTVAVFRGETDITANYNITYRYGKLTVLPRPRNSPGTGTTGNWTRRKKSRLF